MTWVLLVTVVSKTSLWLRFVLGGRGGLKECPAALTRLGTVLQGPRSNFEIGGGVPLVTQYWGGGHKALFLTNSL